MKKGTYFLLSLLVFCLSEHTTSAQNSAGSGSLYVEVNGSKAQRVPLVVVGVGDQDDDLLVVCATIAKNLESTGQFEVTREYLSSLTSVSQMKSWYNQKKPLAVCIQDNPAKGFECRIYKTEKAEMVKGLRVAKKGPLARGWAHAICDAILPELTGEDGYFSGKLVYVNETKKALCVADYDGSHEQVLCPIKSTVIAPRWNRDVENPMVVFSEYTTDNIRLVACDMSGRRYVASSFDGLNMQPSFSSNGKEAVLCLSHEGSSQIYHYGYSPENKQYIYTRLTFNDGNNIAPALLDNGDVIFCSDFENGRPAIYYLHRKKETVERLTEGGASSPSYCSATGKIAYIKMKDGVAQVMSYDLKTKVETQLTFDPTHKQECSWSYCGNYLVFSVHNGPSKRIAMHNVLTGKRTYVTPANVVCSYPHWSFPYNEFPVVV